MDSVAMGWSKQAPNTVDIINKKKTKAKRLVKKVGPSLSIIYSEKVIR